ncbi:MAG: glycosyltransferase [Lachnospiraceae bacterium]|nr:glycosyltransferase [Lachnospiraceae bacterium]
MIKVSVIIPIYNVEKYIEECLLSAMRQTLKEIEIICVNDGTRDDSMQIVRRYAEEDERIVIIDKENGGLSSARNAGIKAAQGEYLYFLDSDDYIAENMLEVLFSECDRDNLDVIYFDAEAFFETPELEEQHGHFKDYYRRPSMFEDVVSGPELFARMENLHLFRPSACLQMLRRDMLLNNSIFFFEGIVHEDNLFSLQTIFAAERVKHIATPFYKRRVREESIMTGGQEFRRSYGYYICITEFNRFLKQFDFRDRDIVRAINHRIYVMQSNAAKAVRTMPLEEIDNELAGYPMETQIWYAMLVKRLVEERQVQQEKYDLLKTKSNKRMEELKSSTSFRAGKAVTVVPRKGYHLVKNIRQKGLPCTLYGIKRKLTNEKRDLEPDRICVSVIIPMYNAQRYLRECLDLLLRQTLKSIEIICVNDGSTDGTEKLLREYESKDSRIKVLDQENQGAGIARNNGMKVAQGEYFLFLDADDIFHEKLCEEAYYKAKYDMADIVLFQAYRYNVQTCEKEEMNWVLRDNLLTQRLPFSAKDTNGQIFQITTACPWSKMFRADFVKKQRLEFQNTKNANDVFFVRMALAVAGRITVVKKRLITYRFNDGSNTQSRKAEAPVEFYKAFKALKLELQKRGLYKAVERSYVNMVLTESLFNLRTAGSEDAGQTVKKLLLEEGFAFFELEKYAESYFYNKKDYKEYQTLLKTNK